MQFSYSRVYVLQFKFAMKEIKVVITDMNWLAKSNLAILNY